MSLHLDTNRFNAGEISPLLYGRVDLQKYGASAKTLENFVPTKYGPIERSLGFECVFDSAATPAVVQTKGNAKCRLERFRYNTTTNYVLAFTDQAIRFYKGGATASQIESSPGTPVEVASPYLEADLFALQVRQINDVMYITHPDYAVRKLSRVSETSWTLAEVSWDFPPMLDVNATATTVYPSGTTGSINLVASSGIFTADNEGGYFAITQTRDAQEQVVNLETTAASQTSAIKVKGVWSLNTVGTWTGTLKVQRRVNSGAWESLREVSSKENANYSITGTESSDDAEYRIDYNITSAGGSDGEGRFQVESAEITGIARIVTYSSATQVSATVVKAFEKSGSGNAVTTWYEGAFSDRRGYPRTATFFQQRLWFASTSYEKQRLWGSQIGDFENFQLGANDGDAIAVDLASDQQNEILWLRSEKRLLCGTSANEWTVGADNLNGAITPSNITAKVHTFVGSDDQPAIMAGSKFLFLTRNTKRLQSFFYNFQIDGYDSEEVSKLAEHITEGGISQMSYQQVRDQIVWMVRGDGQIVGLVYNEEDNVVAFFRRKSDTLSFESVATIYGVDEDEVWVVGKATIDGATKRFIMRRSARTATKEDMVYLDAAITKTGASSATWSGFGHLEGELIDVLADGWVQQGVEVSSGQITLSSTAEKVTGGIPMTSKYRSLNIEAPTGDGTSKGKRKRIVKIDLGLRNSLGGQYGVVRTEAPNNQDVEVTYDRLDRIMGVTLLGSSPDLVSGVFPLTMPEGSYTEVDVLLKQDQPLPMTITHTFPVVDTKGD